MSMKSIAVRLAPNLELEGRGFCDPGEPRNKAIITARNYGAEGYIRVHPSGFIQALIRSGELIQVDSEDRETGRPPSKPANGRRKTPGTKRRKTGSSGRRAR